MVPQELPDSGMRPNKKDQGFLDSKIFRNKLGFHLAGNVFDVSLGKGGVGEGSGLELLESQLSTASVIL